MTSFIFVRNHIFGLNAVNLIFYACFALFDIAVIVARLFFFIAFFAHKIGIVLKKVVP